MKKLVLSIASVLFAAGAAVAQLPDRIVCAGDYGGHLQGVATDGESIYWSFTVAVVKTDLTGKILASREAPSHQGDMCYKDGVVYVAVNRGKFNTETRGVSQVTAYDAKTLEPMWTKSLPDMPHGAGGMTWKGDRFYIIGGLPLKHEKNYVYEYTSDFKFVKRYDLDTGFTWMGIQTAAHEDDTFYFGIYGSKGDPSGVLASPDDLSSYTRYTGAGSVGIIKLDGAYYLGGTGRDKKTKRNTGQCVQQRRQQADFLAGRALRFDEGRRRVQGVPGRGHRRRQGVLHPRPRARRPPRGFAQRGLLPASAGHARLAEGRRGARRRRRGGDARGGAPRRDGHRTMRR